MQEVDKYYDHDKEEYRDETQAHFVTVWWRNYLTQLEYR